MRPFGHRAASHTVELSVQVLFVSASPRGPEIDCVAMRGCEVGDTVVPPGAPVRLECRGSDSLAVLQRSMRTLRAWADLGAIVELDLDRTAQRVGLNDGRQNLDLELLTALMESGVG